MTKQPTLGRIVLYRGKEGMQVMRAALITCTRDNLRPGGVEQGLIPDLDSDTHVHLHVFTPSTILSFVEYNVPFHPGADEDCPPGSWCWPSIK